jgi:hypothetical protein
MNPIMSATLYQDSKETLEETRHRGAEFYFNGTCLARSLRRGRFRKVPFFLRHLWRALNEQSVKNSGFKPPEHETVANSRGRRE